jgi:glycine/D-amino acid oxidase-like deaminating enzyme
MMKRCIEIFSHFQDVVGGASGFVKTGWAFLVPSEAEQGLEENLSMQQRLGINTREISREELLTLEPRFHLDDVARIAYEPDSGYANPTLTTTSYLQAAVNLGGEIMQCCPLTSISIENGRVTQVGTPKGSISTEIVVNAAGPWADRVAAMVGLSLPIRVTREEEILLAPPLGESPPRLTISDMAKAIYFRSDAGRVLVGRGYPKEYEYVSPDDYQENAGVDFIEETARRFAERMPVYSDALVQNAYTGLYDVTPDWHPILGRTGAKGFFLAAGFSGHGFKLGPAIGELMAEEIISGKAGDVDLSSFSLDRFEKGQLFQAVYGGNRA